MNGKSFGKEGKVEYILYYVEFAIELYVMV